MLTDEATIIIKAGNGGNGVISFRREKFVPKGGPDGGDGGKGGDIFFEVNPSTHALSEFSRQKFFKADEGENGRSKRQTGHGADDLVLNVPPGTIIREESQILFDLKTIGEKVRIAKGGKGGLGNIHFATATYQAPRKATKGEPGEEKTLKLELKLLADVGLIGLPNAGKSTLLAHISNATPKIADYPFTTLEPNLGVVKIHDKNIVFADVPGLIGGASQGKGLGDKFLRHIERTKVLVHLLDIQSLDILKDYEDIRAELKAWNPELIEKPEIIAINKIDTLLPKDATKIAKKLSKDIKKDILTISAVSGEGVDKLLATIEKSL